MTLISKEVKAYWIDDPSPQLFILKFQKKDVTS